MCRVGSFHAFQLARIGHHESIYVIGIYVTQLLCNLDRNLEKEGQMRNNASQFSSIPAST